MKLGFRARVCAISLLDIVEQRQRHGLQYAQDNSQGEYRHYPLHVGCIGEFKLVQDQLPGTQRMRHCCNRGLEAIECGAEVEYPSQEPWCGAFGDNEAIEDHEHTHKWSSHRLCLLRIGRHCCNQREEGVEEEEYQYAPEDHHAKVLGRQLREGINDGRLARGGQQRQGHVHAEGDQHRGSLCVQGLGNLVLHETPAFDEQRHDRHALQAQHGQEDEEERHQVRDKCNH
mmetsp:Transcript_84624/g.234638  ORF Transcript_84624/g.234638 Transcript_84624/m.234638 type:complete len:229 (+) Transcript_84624:95-781(+)